MHQAVTIYNFVIFHICCLKVEDPTQYRLKFNKTYLL